MLYYIVPQVWAWKPGRAKTMEKIVDRAFCVFEFEVPFFEKFGLKTEFVGHPLIDTPEPPVFEGPFACGTQEAQWAADPSSRPISAPPVPPLEAAKSIFKAHTGTIKTVSFLPGSRGSEIEHHSKPMRAAFTKAQTQHPELRALWSFPDEKDFNARQVRVTPAPNDSLNAEDAQAQLTSLKVSHSQLLPELSDFSVVKSGTSTLEAGLAGNPMCVVYKGSAASFLIARMLVNIPVFSLVNIVLGRYVVPELLQSEVNPTRLAAEIQRGLYDADYRAKQQAALAEIPKKLGGTGASERAAAGILKFLDGRSK